MVPSKRLAQGQAHGRRSTQERRNHLRYQFSRKVLTATAGALHSGCIWRGCGARGFEPESMSHPRVVKTKIKKKGGGGTRFGAKQSTKQSPRQRGKPHMAPYVSPVFWLQPFSVRCAVGGPGSLCESLTRQSLIFPLCEATVPSPTRGLRSDDRVLVSPVGARE